MAIHPGLIDANAKLDSSIIGNVRASPGHFLLKVDGAPHGVYGARELDEKSVTCNFDDAPTTTKGSKSSSRSALSWASVFASSASMRRL